MVSTSPSNATSSPAAARADFRRIALEDAQVALLFNDRMAIRLIPMSKNEKYRD
jgi:hypothetical protein